MPAHLCICSNVLSLFSLAAFPPFGARSAALAAPLTLPCQALPPVPCRCVPPACRRPACPCSDRLLACLFACSAAPSPSVALRAPIFPPGPGQPSPAPPPPSGTPTGVTKHHLRNARGPQSPQHAYHAGKKQSLGSGESARGFTNLRWHKCGGATSAGSNHPAPPLLATPLAPHAPVVRRFARWLTSGWFSEQFSSMAGREELLPLPGPGCPIQGLLLR